MPSCSLLHLQAMDGELPGRSEATPVPWPKQWSSVHSKTFQSTDVDGSRDDKQIGYPPGKHQASSVLSGSKEHYYLEAPKSVPTSSHLLPENIVAKVLSSKQAPVNPHSQRLLAAEARAAQPVPAKAKAKAKTKAKAKANAKTEADTDHPKKKKKSAEDNGIEPTRTEYSKTKKEFMAEIPVRNSLQ